MSLAAGSLLAGSLLAGIRHPSRANLVVWVLLAAVAAFATVSVAFVLLNERAGGRVYAASRLAERYADVEVALLNEEVARQDLLLGEGSSDEVWSTQREALIAGDRLSSIEDPGHASEQADFEAELTAYQRLVTEFVMEREREGDRAISDGAMDRRARRMVAQAATVSAEHRAEAAEDLRAMRRRQDLGVRLFPILGALCVTLAGTCLWILVTQRRELASLRDEAHTRSVTDELTGLLNRAGLRHALQRALPAAAADCPVALLLLDLDGFKEINDAFGHDHGDDVLRAVAERLLQVAPAGAVVARLGGDEFVVLLPEVSPGGAEELARAIIETLSVPISVRSVESVIGASIGISFAQGPGGSGVAFAASELLRCADIAMYAAKADQDGPVSYSGPSAGPPAAGRQRGNASLRPRDP